MGQQDYHTFRLPYWDWRTEIQTSFGVRSEDVFSENRLGETRNVSGSPVVFGSLYGDSPWETICWLQLGEICDPRNSSGPLQRCPFTGTDPCNSNNPDWPTTQSIKDALDIDEYDVFPYNFVTPAGFRSFVDNKINTNVSELDECRNNRFCQCLPGGADCSGTMVGPALTAQMHFTVSALLYIDTCKIACNITAIFALKVIL